MKYNTQQTNLPLPQFGRSVQHMVDHCLTIEDRAERQHCAETIIDIMEGMFPELKQEEDFRRRLWDYLAIMADFKLDIDYPVDIVKKEALEINPDVMPMTQGNIRFRHYGKFTEQLLSKAAEMPEGETREEYIRLVASHMKLCYIEYNNETIDDEKIFADILELSDGKIKIEPGQMNLYEPRSRSQAQYRPKNGGKNFRKKNNNNNNQRGKNWRKK